MAASISKYDSDEFIEKNLTVIDEGSKFLIEFLCENQVHKS